MSRSCDIFSRYRPDTPFEQAWTETLGGDPAEDLGGTHHLTVVASDVDPATERIIGYLAAFDVPVNVVFFRYFSDGDRAYLARTWLLDEIQPGSKKDKGAGSGTKEPWNRVGLVREPRGGGRYP